MKKKLLVPLLSCYFVPLLLWFLVTSINAETTAASYIYFNKTPYHAGMGNLDTVFTERPSITGNPALLAHAPESSLLFGGGAGEDDEKGSTNKFDLILKVKNLGIGIGFFNYGQSFDFLDADGNPSGSLDYGGNIFSLAGGFAFSENISMGIGIQNIEDTIAVSGLDDYTASATIFNLGFHWKYKRLRYGYSMLNAVGATIGEGEGDELPVGSKFGIGYETDRFRIGFAGGADQVTGYVNLGLEYRLADWFAVRFGLETSDDVGIPTAGFSIKPGSFSFDFAVTMHEDLGQTTTLAIEYNWGGEKKEKVKEKPVKKVKPVEKPKPAPVKEAAPIELPEIPEDEKVNVAVTDFEARAPLSQSEAAFISDFVRADIVRAGRFNVVEKNNMDKVLAEQGFQQTGCTTSECAVQIGKLLNVKMMIVGSCGKLLGKYIITMNVVNVESAKIVYSDDVSVTDPDELRNTIRGMINKFSRSVK